MKKQFEFLIYLPLAAILNYASMHVPGLRKIFKIKNGITIVLYKYSDGNVYLILLIFIYTRLSLTKKHLPNLYLFHIIFFMAQIYIVNHELE